MRKVSTPLSKRVIKSLNIGEEVLVNGVIYTACDGESRTDYTNPVHSIGRRGTNEV